MSRIFLSHSSQNNAEALALREWLASQGWNDVFLDIDPVHGLVAADRWQKALYAAIGRCRAVIFLLSPEWRASEHCISEFDLAGYIGAERVGVIIKDIALDKLPAGLGGENQIVNLTRGGIAVSFTVNPPPERRPVTVNFPVQDLSALRMGLARLGLVGFDPDSFPWPPPDEPDRAPFRGLEALDLKDAGVFFGRDADLVRAREHLIDVRKKGGRKLFVIVGASGSGKSSFMRAGLLPRLAREDRDFATLPLMRLGTAPLSSKMGLAAALQQASDQLQQPWLRGNLLAALEHDPNALPPLLNKLQVLAMQRLVGPAKPQVDLPPTLVLAIDQAEELFAIGAGREAACMRHHLAAALRRGPDSICLLTIRSDRFSLLQQDDELKTLLEPFNLPAMEATVYRDAILRPATRATPPLKIDSKLTQTLIHDTAHEGADPLPLLAFTLERLYQGYRRAPEGIELKHYLALGGIAGSINAAITDSFSEPERNPPIPTDRHERERLQEAAFIPALVDIDPASAEPVSRIANEQDIPSECLNLVARLVNARLLVSAEGRAGTNGTKLITYRVAHDALLRRWDWLDAVIRARAGQLAIIHIVEQQAKTWEANNFSTQWLDLRGDRLKQALSIIKSPSLKRRLQGLPMHYLAACRSAEKMIAAKRYSIFASTVALIAFFSMVTADLLNSNGAFLVAAIDHTSRFSYGSESDEGPGIRYAFAAVTTDITFATADESPNCFHNSKDLTCIIRDSGKLSPTLHFKRTNGYSDASYHHESRQLGLLHGNRLGTEDPSSTVTVANFTSMPAQEFTIDPERFGTYNARRIKLEGDGSMLLVFNPLRICRGTNCSRVSDPVFGGEAKDISDVAYNAKNDLLAVLSKNLVHVRSLKDGIGETYQFSAGKLVEVAFSENGEHLLIKTKNHQGFSVWTLVIDVQKRGNRISLQPHSILTMPGRMSTDGHANPISCAPAKQNNVAVFPFNNHQEEEQFYGFDVYNLKTRESVRSEDFGRAVNAVCINAAGTRIVTSSDKNVKVWAIGSLPDGRYEIRELWTQDTADWIRWARYSSDGRKVIALEASAGQRPRILIMDAETGLLEDIVRGRRGQADYPIYVNDKFLVLIDREQYGSVEMVALSNFHSLSAKQLKDWACSESQRTLERKMPDRPSRLVFTSEEREKDSYLRGREADVCSWKNLSSWDGWWQLMIRSIYLLTGLDVYREDASTRIFTARISE